jgi:hypothetical protein
MFGPESRQPAAAGRTDMIVIRATGSTDVKSLRKLARSLSAEPSDISVEDLAPPAPAVRKGSKPTVSTLPGASVSAQTREAILKLQPAEVEAGGEYELS